MPNHSMLVLEDDASFAEAACRLVEASGFEPHRAASCAEARDAVRTHHFEYALIDIGLPDGCGLDLLSDPALASARRKIVMSGDTALASSLGSMLRDTPCIAKPFNVASLRALLDVPAGNDAARPPTSSDLGLMGISPVMRAIRAEIDAAAPLPIDVVIYGESGTGKELAARRLHTASGRQGAFIALNAAMLSPELLASHLFGHLKGSFTGASERRRGLVDAADGGTLFIDELADMPAAVQAALLRFLETREVTPLGSAEGHPVDVRIVCATNRAPLAAVADGTLRHDLYYRLAGLELRMPALREHPDDVPLIASRFLDALNVTTGRRARFSDHAFHQVRDYPWPGNVRELRQCVQRAFVRAKGSLMLERPEPGQLPASRPLVRKLADIERDAILAALSATGGDRAHAAHLLGISERTIYNKLAQYRDAGASREHAW
jgi:DNA-binding NtrC family response regulator